MVRLFFLLSLQREMKLFLYISVFLHTLEIEFWNLLLSPLIES